MIKGVIEKKTSKNGSEYVVLHIYYDGYLLTDVFLKPTEISLIEVLREKNNTK